MLDSADLEVLTATKEALQLKVAATNSVTPPQSQSQSQPHGHLPTDEPALRRKNTGKLHSGTSSPSKRGMEAESN